MLSQDLARYVDLHRSLGFKFRTLFSRASLPMRKGTVTAMSISTASLNGRQVGRRRSNVAIGC